jgi:hypothetical protein
MTVSLGKDRKCTAKHLTATHATVTELTIKQKNCTWTISYPPLSFSMTSQKNNCCGTVRLNKQGMPEDLRCKKVKLGWEGDIGVRTRVDLTAVQWLDKRDACMLTNIHSPPQEGSFCSEQECNKTRHGGL